jgi:hypothetical protein
LLALFSTAPICWEKVFPNKEDDVSERVGDLLDHVVSVEGFGAVPAAAQEEVLGLTLVWIPAMMPDFGRVCVVKIVGSRPALRMGFDCCGRRGVDSGGCP